MSGRELANGFAALADHVETELLRLVEQVEALRGEAEAELERRESSWRPVAVRLASWLESGRLAVHRMDVADLDTAERWLKRMSDEIRDERFTPISQRSQEIWRTLRLRSMSSWAASSSRAPPPSAASP
ncbi:MAG: hypothetical protein M3198_18635 [Actinomycetota bacterium]|nr:hypothetical protein [Actinomycetota bacterium]